MSLLLLNLPTYAEALITRLLRQGDEVRVVEHDRTLAERWVSSGAHVAPGRASDPDLVERAAQGARSVVVMDRRGEDLAAVVRSAVEGAKLASRDMRLIVCARDVDGEVLDIVRRSLLEHVVIQTGSVGDRRLLRSRTPSEKVFEAIDAGDDLPGHPRLELDLDNDQAWRELGLEPP